jgi:allophanate hydrolase
MLADPIALNARFGLYTNFANLLACSAIAVPAGFTAEGVPFGVTLVAPADRDDALAPFASQLHAMAKTGSGIDRAATPPLVAAEGSNLRIAVVGAHLSGMALNHELVGLGATLLEETRTAPHYRLFALNSTVPPKPGLQREPGFAGPGIVLEVWELPAAGLGQFVAKIPAPLGVGKIELADGRQVTGFLCEAAALADARDITDFGGWRAYFSEAKRLAG